MKKLIAASEYQHGSGSQTYYKTYVQRADGSMVAGTRSLHAFKAGSQLNRRLKNLQANIDAGGYAGRE